MFSTNPDSSPCMFHACISESHAAEMQSSLPKSMIYERLLEHLGNSITHECTQKETGKYVTLHKLDVYVLTPDQLECLVQRRAMRLHPSAPSVHLVST